MLRGFLEGLNRSLLEVNQNFSRLAVMCKHKQGLQKAIGVFSVLVVGKAYIQAGLALGVFRFILLARPTWKRGFSKLSASGRDRSKKFAQDRFVHCIPEKVHTGIFTSCVCVQPFE